MKTPLKIILWVIGYGFLFVNSLSANQSPIDLAAVEAQFRSMVANNERAGIAWIVAKDGQVISEGALGWRDLERRLPLDDNSTFRLYSMTRAITTVAALRLVESGQLQLDTPLAEYLPKFASMKVLRPSNLSSSNSLVQAKRDITILDLMTYQAGFGYAYDYPSFLGVNRDDILGLKTTTEDGIDHLAQFPLLNQPGERWHYGFASDVLGRVIEQVTDESLDKALQRLIFAPLDMSSTGFHSSLNRLVKAYGPDSATGELIDVTDALPKSADYLKPSRMHSGGGGLVSTTDDYFKFCEMLRRKGMSPNGRLINESTVELMATNSMRAEQGPLFWHRDDASPVMLEAGWGLGIGVRLQDIDTESLTSRQGELFWGGLAGTGFFIDPTSGITAVVMTQYLGPESDKPAIFLRRAIYDALSKASDSHKETRD